MSAPHRASPAALSALALALAVALTGPPARAAAPPAAVAAPDSAAAAAASPAQVDATLRRALERMAGVIPGSDTVVAWDLFRAHPQRTVDLVLPTLKPVRPGLSLGAPNMVWRIRVLQRLTGLAYTAPTRAKLSADERRSLTPDSLGRVPFAGEDAARGMTWVAPADAQKAIIARWRRWWASDMNKPELPVKKHDDDRTWWYAR